MRPIVDPQKIERLMQVLGREAKGAGSVYFVETFIEQCERQSEEGSDEF